MTGKAYSREVVATRPGYYGVYRQEGDKFIITAPEHFSERWMADAGTAVKAVEPAPLEDPAAAELREALGLEGELQALRQREAKLRAELDAALAAKRENDNDNDNDNEGVGETAGDAEANSDERPIAATRRRRALAS